MKPLKKKIDLDEVRQKIYEKLKPSGWGDKLKTFILSSDFKEILAKLLKEANEGRRFTPKLNQVFRAFEECPYDDMIMVMVGQDPYPKIDVADGVAFSCSNTMKIQPSLSFIFKELEAKLIEGDYDRNVDLTRWSNQGILMLNTALTTTIGKVGTHYDIWKPFIEFLFDMFATQNSGIIYLFMGSKAKSWSNMIPKETNDLFFVTHPASAVYKKDNVWDTKDTFQAIDKLIKDRYGRQINW